MPPIKKPVTPEQALVRLETMCARAEHCTYELREKMRGWGINPAEAEKIIGQLVKTKFVNDARFAQAYARDKITFAGWGRRKVAQALMLKRIDRQTVNEVLENIDTEVYAKNLMSALRQKLRQLGDAADTYEGRTKAFRFAVSRGYEPDLVAANLRKLITNNQ